MIKFIRIIAAAMAAFFCLQIVAFAEGDPNIDNGGGGLKDGSSENFWNPGNDGVRITVPYSYPPYNLAVVCHHY